jgi:hypothetical protein
MPRTRRPAERWVLGLGAVFSVLLVGIAVYSLTSHASKSGKGCLNFTYTMAMGAEIVHECGTPARKLCATPLDVTRAQGNIAGLENDLTAKLPANCREAGLPYNTGHATATPSS